MSGGDDAAHDSNEENTGRLGLGLEPGPEGWRVADVVPDGPCDKEASRVRVDDVVLAIDGEPLDADTILARRLAGRIGERVVLEVARGGDREKRERLVVRPTSWPGLRGLHYDRWTGASRRVVGERSEGRLGYIHIRSMNETSLEQFETELYARAHGRAGLVIDVRSNGGGWTADYLLAILAAPAHAYTIPRGGGRGYPQGRRPLAAWSQPIAVICDERSFSNAEIFSHAIKTTGRGILVGNETFGGVISTGSTTLLDGTRLRLPFRGWYLPNGHDMDKGGAVPDILILNVPGETRDRQVEAAVDELLKRIAH